MPSSANVCSTYGVRSENVEKEWPKVKDFISSALEYCDGKTNLAQVKTCLLNKDMQLWLYAHSSGKILAVCVTRIVKAVKHNRLDICFAAGKDEHASIENFIDTFSQFARANACEAIEMTGRKGWQKRLSDLGFEFVYLTVRKWL